MQRPATLPALALVMGLALLYGGGSLLVAGIAGHQAEAFLQDWATKGVEPDERAWESALAAAQRSIDAYPTANGDYLHRLGLIQLWKQRSQPLGAPDARPARIAAREAFRAASRAQPTRPDHWTALADAKLQLLEFDAEFHTALQLAHELGPWRTDVNRRLSAIGLLAWSHLSEAERATIEETIRRTLGHSQQEARSLLAIAERLGMNRILCDALSPPLKGTHDICRPFL